MHNTILEKWQYKAKKNSKNIVIPDGCRDILFWASKGQSPRCTITSLDEKSYFAAINAGDYLQGFRLRAGTIIKQQQLFSSLKGLASLRGFECEREEISERIENFTYLCPNVKEALDCLASDVIRISEVAKLLGVSTRTLQRLLKSQTGRTPAAWLSLARVRKTARIIGGSVNLAQSAIMCGYSDQAHMNREFRRWLNITPAKINSHPEILRQLDNLAYN